MAGLSSTERRAHGVTNVIVERGHAGLRGSIACFGKRGCVRVMGALVQQVARQGGHARAAGTTLTYVSAG